MVLDELIVDMAATAPLFRSTGKGIWPAERGNLNVLNQPDTKQQRFASK
jgi:hypothetical protein